ncbi:MAG: hypothetical protein H6618_05140 [Deltaproteobacteria bacterium]|nr:hypothetical protein [Deltaproteobacteria bacterium]
MLRRNIIRLCYVLAVLASIFSAVPAFCDHDSTRATISAPSGTLKNSSHVTEVVASANWFMETAPMVVAVGLLLFAAIMLVRAQYVMALMVFLGGLLAAGALKIVSSISG